MSTIQKSKQNIVNKINKALSKKIVQASDLFLPPNPEMGDLSFPCFSLAKEIKKSPIEIANVLASQIKPCQTVKEIKAVGPYINFTLQSKKLAQGVLNEISNPPKPTARRARILVEYGTPNTHKAFHIGHLRNITTGEAISRILKNAGYEVVNVNYQGDIGMHVAKCLWGVIRLERKLKKIIKTKDLDKKVQFLGEAYVLGSATYEKEGKEKQEIIELNKRIYVSDKSIIKIYKETRKWSLQYFDKIYKRVNTKFDKLYFESDTFALGKKLVMEGVKKGIFKTSEGAIIFPGAEYGLHNRVFINSEGNATYEAKDMALAKLQLAGHNPDKILHVVSKEQIEYFKVIFKAMEFLIPKSKGKEQHLEYGWMSLKNGKMSSRLGNVVLGEVLLDEVKKEIKKIIKKNKPSQTDGRADRKTNKADKEVLAEKISLAAVKFSILKNGINKDISFDIKESINLSGNSGPYLQYTYARIKSILHKLQITNYKLQINDLKYINEQERRMLFKMSLFPEITQSAAEKLDPSIIAKYLFELAQEFNDYYHKVHVLNAKDDEKAFKLALISAIAQIIDKGVNLLGFKTVKRM